MLPTLELLQRRAEALGIEIEYEHHPDEERVTCKTAIDLTAAVDALAIYQAKGIISASEERAGRYYALGRLVSFGHAFPSQTVIGKIVASDKLELAASSVAAGQTLTDEEREERRAEIMGDYREADRRLRRDQPRVVRAIVRQVCLDGEMVRPHHHRQLRAGLGFLADLWRIEEDD